MDNRGSLRARVRVWSLRRVRSGVVLVMALLTSPALATVNHPFGAHTFTYAAGSIRPTRVSAAAQDQAVADFYDAWKARFLAHTCGTGR